MLSYEKPTDIYSWGADLLNHLEPLWLLFDPAGHLWMFEYLEERSGLNGHVNLHRAQLEEDWPPLRAWILFGFLPRFLLF